MGGARHSSKPHRGDSGFSPQSLASVTAWLRLSDATIVSSDVSVLPDFLNSNPAVQTVSGRRPTLGLSTGNGVRRMTFATNDVLSWPIGTGNNGRDQKGFAFWARSSTGATERWISIGTGTGGASAMQLEFYHAGSTIRGDAYISGSNGRRGQIGSPTGFSNGAWVWLRLMYDSSQSTEATKLKIYVNGALQTSSFFNVGSGGTLGTLPSVTGNILIGNAADGTASSPLNGDLGPNLYVLNADLSAADELALMNFERPT